MRAAVDRISGTAAHADAFACVEFEASSGLWCVARFRDDQAESEWSGRVKSAFRLLADTGFGAGRVIGWGQAAQPEMQPGIWPQLLLPRSSKAQNGRAHGDSMAGYWLLSLYSPARSESPDWSRGDYELVTRGGHLKKTVKMVSEGAVLVADQEPSGTAVDVAPTGHSHPIYRAGFAVALRLPEIVEEDIKPVEEPSDQEAPEAKPCAEPAAAQEQPVEMVGETEQARREREDGVPEPERSQEHKHEL
jgi:CRISPR type III-A-associated RAMP protein Csm4